MAFIFSMSVDLGSAQVGCNTSITLLGWALVGESNGLNKFMNQLSVFDALADFHARADIDTKASTTLFKGADGVAHVCRCESTRQNEVSIDVYWKL